MSRPRGSGHSVSGRRRRPGGQGRQLRKPEGCRRSRRARRALRRGGRRRADVPRRDGVVVGPGHHARRGPTHRRAGVHPADGRRRRAVGRRRRHAAAGRRGQGVGEHRGHRAPRAARRSCRSQFGSQCIVLSVDARTVPEGSEPTPSGWEVTTHGGRTRHRHRRGRVGRPRRRARASARSCSTRWTPTAPRRASIYACCARSAAR